MVYLIKSASNNKNKVFYKIGFTYNLETRLKAYISDNPTIQVIETINTHKKTKHQLEKQLHKELIKQGYKFHISLLNKQTEWFEVDKKTNISLNNFKCCKNRKVITNSL